MDKKDNELEKEYLSRTLAEIDILKEDGQKKYKENLDTIQKLQKYIAENYYYVKDEAGSLRAQMTILDQQNLSLTRELQRLDRQKKNPYFGRFDFKADDQTTPQKFYIGLGLVQDKNETNWVYDWRADVCSIYYDDQIGHTSYICPQGQISGDVSLKRQFKIQNGKLVYYIDSNMVIDDEILMEQLSKNATTKMHDIVSTIQKEQNVLIRADDMKNTIVQGVAGSGKTSIAMHRVSYLLYKYRDKLKSEDILILSPSESFADYIGEVLPTLGESGAFTTTFSNMAKRLLNLPFESREDMLERVISKQNQQDFENIAVKSSFEFLDALKNFLDHDICNLFIPKTLNFQEMVITKEDLHDVYFNRLSKLPVHKRVEVLAENIADRFNVTEIEHNELVERAKKILYHNFMTVDLLRIYNLFLRSQELSEVTSIGAYDIAPVMLIKENLFGLKKDFDAKYVIVDEMQDYTPCHFYLFDKIWKCQKLYLGDVYQSIDRTLSPEYLTYLAKLTHAKVKFLTKSYRSTLQISLFSQKILGKRIAQNVNRNGEEVECLKVKSCAKAIDKVLKLRESDSKLKKQSVAIICKSKDEIAKLQKESALISKFKIMSDTQVASRRIITTPAKAKGIEFDCVIIPFANAENYRNELDRNLLYVASTRALHKLYFLSDSKPSKFLLKNNKKKK